MEIHIIWAQEKNGGIGKNGKLPWNIPEDLQNFKKITLGSTILMGRKTWDSLPFKPLPDRRNIILSTNNIPNIECYSSIKNCIKTLNQDNIKKLFIIGGSMVYSKTIDIADELHITLVKKKTKNIDTYFPIKFSVLRQKFKKINEYKLSDEAIYSHWIKKTL